MRKNLRAAMVLVACCLLAGAAWASIDHGTLGVADTTTVTNILQVTDHANDDMQQCWGSEPWSADGQRLVYTSEVDGTSSDDREICIIGADGTGWARLTNNTGCDSHASFTPDGRILFQSDRVGDYARVFIMSANGSGQTDLTAAHGGPVDSCENKPLVSPDGTMIAFHTCDEEIWVMNIDGTSPVRISGGYTNSNRHVWSANSRWVFFDCDETGDREIYRAAADGSELLGPLTDPADGDCANWPSVSPNGQWVAYHQDDDDGLGAGVTIRLMSAGTCADLGILVDGGGTEVCGPTTWSPNSEWLSYKMNTGTSREIYMINVGTGEVRHLTQGYYDYRHRWSPDGSRIMFQDWGTNRDGSTLGSDLLVLNLASPALFAFQQQAGIPTLGSIGIVLLALLTAGAGVIFVRRWLA